MPWRTWLQRNYSSSDGVGIRRVEGVISRAYMCSKKYKQREEGHRDICPKLLLAETSLCGVKPNNTLSFSIAYKPSNAPILR